MDSEIPPLPKPKKLFGGLSKGVLIFLGILLMMGFLGSFFEDDKKPETTTQQVPAPPPPDPPQQAITGDRAILSSGSPGQIAVAIDENAFDEMLQTARAKDTIGWAELLTNGKIFIVQEKTPVLVIKIGFLKTRVRILDGDNIGMAGWVPMELVVK